MVGAPVAQAPAAPASEAALLERAHALSGHTLQEVACQLGRALPAEPKRAKGFIGELIERALGAQAGSKPQPDFPTLGIELKTIPLDERGRPAESTFVCSIDLRRVAQVEWQDCRVYRKLARVLFVPIESSRKVVFADRRIGRPLLWSPNELEQAALRADWEDLLMLLSRGEYERISAHLGSCLQVRPKAAHSGVRVTARDDEGAPVSTLPRGFYLRASFTGRLFS